MPPQSRGNHRRPGSRSLSTPNPEPPDLDATASAKHLSAGEDEDDDDEDVHSHASAEAERDFPPNTSSEDEHDLMTSSLTPTAPNAGQRPALTPRSHSYGPAAFAPPFYNRPPTPLPPSPSLTSLLRPLPFGAPLSRTTTPESSDTESTGNAAAGIDPTAAAVAQSARVSTVPRASPKIPTYEYYGFVVYLGSSLAFLMYLLWSYLPTPFLHRLGIYYYPNRWWSLAVPAWLVIAVLYIYIALAAWNTGVLTLPLSSLECFVDDKGSIAVVDASGKIVSERQKNAGQRKAQADSAKHHGKMGPPGRKTGGAKSNDAASPPHLNWREVWNEGTDAVLDVPIGGVCEILYGSGRD